jgi:hypothetical protein
MGRVATIVCETKVINAPLFAGVPMSGAPACVSSPAAGAAI